MKNLEYYCMAIVFAMAGLSAVAWFGNEVYAWFWQVVTMMWVVYAFMLKRQLDDK